MSQKKLIIVMYHHVRRKNETFFPKLKSVNLKLFNKQINYLKKKYKILNINEFRDFIKNKKKLSKDSCIITFDDGYKNHFENVFPILKKKGIQGFFFPPSKAILSNTLMDSNKAQLLLASCNDTKLLNRELELLFNLHDVKKLINTTYEKLKKKYKKPFGYDDAETILFKRLIQIAIPQKIRSVILNKLIKKFINIDEKILSKNLYLSIPQIKKMIKEGMVFGNHGHNHSWLGKNSERNQKYEIKKGLDFLKLIGMGTKEWIMCYPYGSYNKKTLKILKKKKCLVAFTTVNREYSNTDTRFEIPRIDCNNIFNY